MSHDRSFVRMSAKPSQRPKTLAIHSATIGCNGSSPPFVRSRLVRYLCISAHWPPEFGVCFHRASTALRNSVSTGRSALAIAALWGQRTFDTSTSAERVGHRRCVCSCARLLEATHHCGRVCQNRTGRFSGHLGKGRTHSVAAQDGHSPEAVHP